MSQERRIIVMKKCILLCLTFLISVYCNAQNDEDYSLEGLSKACLNCTRITPFHEGLAFITKDEKKGVIDKKGNIIVPIEYDDISTFTNGTANVYKGDMEGEIDNKGKMITPFHKMSDEMILVDSYSVNENTYKYSEGLAVMDKNDKFGYIDENGTIVISPKYDLANDFHDGLAVVAVIANNSFNYGYVDKQGREIMPCQFFDAIDFSEGFAVVRKEMGSTYCFYNTKGEKEFNTDFNYCRSFKEGMAVIGNEEGKMGYINQHGEMVIPYNYDYLDDFSEGLAIVMRDGKLGYIDKQGRCTLDF